MSRSGSETKSHRRWYGAAIALSLATFVIAAIALQVQVRAVKHFCDTLPVGWTTAQVREAAQEQGFRVRIDPFTQMRILPYFWDPSRRSCRVFFNREQTVEYRSWQES